MQTSSDNRAPATKRHLADQDAVRRRQRVEPAAIALLGPGELQVALSYCTDMDLVRLGRAGSRVLRVELSRPEFWLERLAPRFLAAASSTAVLEHLVYNYGAAHACLGGGPVCDAMWGAYFYYAARKLTGRMTSTLSYLRGDVAQTAINERNAALLRFALTHVYYAGGGAPPVALDTGVLLTTLAPRPVLCLFCEILRNEDYCGTGTTVLTRACVTRRNVCACPCTPIGTSLRPNSRHRRGCRWVVHREARRHEHARLVRVWFDHRDGTGRPMAVTACMARHALEALRHPGSYVDTLWNDQAMQVAAAVASPETKAEIRRDMAARAPWVYPGLWQQLVAAAPDLGDMQPPH